MIYRAGVAAEAAQACLPEMWDWLENGRAKDSPGRLLELSHRKDKFFSPFLRASSASSTDLLCTTGARGRVVFVVAFHHLDLGEGISLGWLWETLGSSRGNTMPWTPLSAKVTRRDFQMTE